MTFRPFVPFVPCIYPKRGKDPLETILKGREGMQGQKDKRT